MFVISLTSEKLKKYLIIALVCALTTIGGIISVSGDSTPAAKVGGVNMRAGTAEERVAFFSQFGYEIAEDPLEVKEIIIPTEFDETYEEYNRIQKSQGLDLSKYQGKRVKMWSYAIMNYPGYETAEGTVRGNILVYDGVVIGGDVSNIELGGFMVGFADNSEFGTNQ